MHGGELSRGEAPSKDEIPDTERSLRGSLRFESAEALLETARLGAQPLTINRPTEEWGQFLGDVPAAIAILDRFLAHAELIQMQGKSYRLHQLARRAEKGVTSRPST